jgi:hypothetical protein|mmetsp:Transcript_280/g.733  ORF Transcript_280/g.733 Transcript_280/m.733 type:complete len:94 (+) Transcript_280:178-459(+)
MKKAFVIAKQHGLVEYLVSSGSASTASHTGTEKAALTTTITGTDETKTKGTTSALSTAFPTIPARAPPPKTLGRTNSKSLKRKTPSKKNKRSK